MSLTGPGAAVKTAGLQIEPGDRVYVRGGQCGIVRGTYSDGSYQLSGMRNPVQGSAIRKVQRVAAK